MNANISERLRVEYRQRWAGSSVVVWEVELFDVRAWKWAKVGRYRTRQRAEEVAALIKAAVEDQR